MFLETSSSLGYCTSPTPVAIMHNSFYPLPGYVRMETVCFQFSREYIPELQSIGGENPRIYFDLQPAETTQHESEEAVNGTLVHKIRYFLHQEDKRQRVVLDLNKDFDYQVERRYSLAENRLCLVIQAEK